MPKTVTGLLPGQPLSVAGGMDNLTRISVYPQHAAQYVIHYIHVQINLVPAN